MLDIILTLMVLGFMGAMVMGIFKPGLVIFWGQKKTRFRAFAIYGILMVLSFIALGSTPDKPPAAKPTASAVQTASAAPQTPVPVEVPKKIGITEANQRINDWLWDHEFPGVTKLSLSEGSLATIDGQEYYQFILSGLRRQVDILVDHNTGALFYHDLALKPQDINKWYIVYRASMKASTSSPKLIPITSEFAWVEQPSIQDGYIIGKVKNTSNKVFPTAYIEFGLLNSDHAKLGSVAAEVRNLKPGEVWSFSISPALYQNVSSFELGKIKGYDY